MRGDRAWLVWLVWLAGKRQIRSNDSSDVRSRAAPIDRRDLVTFRTEVSVLCRPYCGCVVIGCCVALVLGGWLGWFKLGGLSLHRFKSKLFFTFRHDRAEGRTRHLTHCCHPNVCCLWFAASHAQQQDATVAGDGPRPQCLFSWLVGLLPNSCS